ncbi:GLPGLI family protein [Fibrella forsythiae]|uniref:GLPGLI family protein n=1 Tax=Fibrella forsythiae TaxID=2817061 RepID=A0ABS3JGV7_9BACT|nr:GLPGLI family protein [Fibrella forsythiae]MBO0948494.1 GLPGLI family protein [Fibrella forsythiae]
MKLRHYAILAATSLLSGAALAQTSAPASGTIAYETMRRTDLSNMRININGQEVRPGGAMPDGRTFNPPETVEGTESYRFAGQWAMREPMDRRNMMQMRFQGGGPGGPGSGDGNGGGGGGQQGPTAEQRQRMERFRNMRPPIEETTHTNLATGKTYTITALTVDSTRKDYYQSEQLVSRPADWEVSGKTKKILGYNCQKATCTVKDQPCTIWFTTELPFTFSPAPNFTPDKGVVLLIESDDLLYRATKVAAGTVDEASLKPSTTAKPVTKEELGEIRRKAMATFRQQSGMQFQQRN